MKLQKIYIFISLLGLLSLSACADKQHKAEQPVETVLEQPSETETNPQTSMPKTIQEEIDLSRFFDGINGCAVLYSPENNKYSLYHPDLCKKEVSPYSTFKIITALAGLENGVIRDETSTMNYNGFQYAISEWNDNLSLEEAFQTSCIWYFRQVIDEIGSKEMSEILDTLNYGNCDISEWNGSGINPQKELNGFWLQSSLKISPLEQVQVLSKIFEGDTDFNEENIEILKKIMLVEESGDQKIYGKTGSSPIGEAWFVGFIEEDTGKKYFAVYLNDEAQSGSVSGAAAKEIALKIMK